MIWLFALLRVVALGAAVLGMTRAPSAGLSLVLCFGFVLLAADTLCVLVAQWSRGKGPG